MNPQGDCDVFGDWSVCYHMTRPPTRRAALKSLFCAALSTSATSTDLAAMILDGLTASSEGLGLDRFAAEKLSMYRAAGDSSGTHSRYRGKIRSTPIKTT